MSTSFLQRQEYIHGIPIINSNDSCFIFRCYQISTSESNKDFILKRFNARSEELCETNLEHLIASNRFCSY